MRDHDPSKIRFTGPLAELATGWRETLEAQRYAAVSVATKLRLAAHLSRWLQERGLGAADLFDPVIKDFVTERSQTHKCLASAEALGPFLDYLRSLNAIPVPAPFTPVTAQEILLAEYQAFLLTRRGLSGPVIAAYGRWIMPFLDHLQKVGCRVQKDEVTGEIIADYLTSHLSTMSRKSAKMTASVLRSFLGFTHAVGYGTQSLSAAVPPVVSWRLAGLPQPLAADEAASLLAAVNRTTSTGKRDYAVVLLLLRMGLRRSEIAVMRLEDIDWVTGVLAVHGKGGRISTLPLPVDVGAALVDYLREARPPRLEAREVFIRVLAPYRGLTPCGVTCIVARLAEKAGIGTIYAHRLRHTAGSNVLNAGASMEEVAQFLRHTNIETSVIYAKTDMTRLAGLARPWPVAGASS